MELTKDTPAAEFTKELNELIARWKGREQLTISEMVGILTVTAHMVTHDTLWGE